MDGKQGWSILRLVVRGSLLFLGLICFVHYRMTQPELHQHTAECQSFLGRLACKAGISETQARKVLVELGPALATELKKGNQVELPNLGGFRLIPLSSPTGTDSSTRTVQKIVEYLPDVSLLDEINLPPPAVAQQPTTATPPARIPPPPPGP